MDVNEMERGVGATGQGRRQRQGALAKRRAVQRDEYRADHGTPPLAEGSLLAGSDRKGRAVFRWPTFPFGPAGSPSDSVSGPHRCCAREVERIRRRTTAPLAPERRARGTARRLRRWRGE